MFEKNIARKLGGIYAPTFSPCDESGKVNPELLQRYVSFLLDNGLTGNYLCGSTGEGILMSLEQRKVMTEATVEVSKGRGQVMVHVGALSTADAVELAKHAAKSGADSLSAIPPIFLMDGYKSVVAHYTAIGAATDLPLVIYNIPSRMGFTLSQAQLLEIADIPGVAGMKFTSTDLFTLQQITSQLGDDFVVYNGSDQILVAGLLMGAHGGIGTSYNVFPKIYVKLYEYFKAGKIAEAKKLQYVVNKFIAEMVKGNGLGFGKACMKWHGFDLGDVRLPMLMPSEARMAAAKPVFDEVNAVMKSL
ncbi:dihydrodipicolinate synthase family protein [bacterium]|nr:dihydrodipicolinate synthase family protein [bacterium]